MNTPNAGHSRRAVSDRYAERMADRLENGNAWMMCHDCGAKLWDFDGNEDKSRSCPYRDSSGECNPKVR